MAIVTTSWPKFAGDPSGHFVETEARALTRCGEVTVIAGEGAAFGWPGIAARIRRRPWCAFGAASWVARARRQVAEGGFDRVVAHWAVPCAWPIADGAAGAALEVVSHGGDVRLLARLPSAITARIAQRAERWRFVSEPLLASLLAAVPRAVQRAVERVARVEACAIEVEAPRAEAIEAKRAAVGAPFAVCVARLVATKRVDAAIAWAAERGRHLVVVGDGPERGRLERAARARGAQVTFVGRVTRREALAWIAAARELVHASRIEGLSTVVREAEALGTRVVGIGADEGGDVAIAR